MTPEMFQKRIIKHIDQSGGVNATARRLNVSPAFISLVYNGKKTASALILNDMKFSKTIITDYKEVKP